MKRLHQMKESFQDKYPEIKDPCDNIFVEKASTIEELWAILEQKLPQFIEEKNVKIVIIDSIAALVRFEYSGEEALERSKHLWKQAKQLKALSDW